MRRLVNPLLGALCLSLGGSCQSERGDARPSGREARSSLSSEPASSPSRDAPLASIADPAGRALPDVPGPDVTQPVPLEATPGGFALPRLEAKAPLVTLPAALDQPFRIVDAFEKMTLSISLEGARRVTGRLEADGSVRYPTAHEGRDVWFRGRPDGVEDFVEVRELAGTTRYRVGFTGVAGVRVVEDTVEFLEADGNPVLRMAPPMVRTKKKDLVPARVAVSGCRFDSSPKAPWGREVVSPRADSCLVTVSWKLSRQDELPAQLDPVWTTTGSMAVARAAHKVARVDVGTTPLLLAAGGFNAALAGITSAELFNEVTGTWAATQSMFISRAYFSLNTTNPIGIGQRVVAAGGAGGANISVENQTAELYDPNVTSNMWALAGISIGAARSHHTGTALPDGRIVLIGGQTGMCGALAGPNRFNEVVVVTLVPAGTLITTALNAPLISGRATHTAILVTGGSQDGKILVVGGLGTCCGGCVGSLTSAELVTVGGATAAAGTMSVAARTDAALHAFSNGTVLVAGGTIDIPSGLTATNSQLWQPPATFRTAAPMPSNLQHGGFGAFGIRSNGTFVVSGGTSSGTADGSTNRTAVFDPVTGTWAADGVLPASLRGIGPAVSPLGRVVSTGGVRTPGSFIVSPATYVFDLLPNGDPCTGNGVCQSQLCVDGVCCNTACNGDCNACDVAGSVGTCTPLTSATVCRASSGACDAAETCNGAANCPADALATVGTVCRPANGACDTAEACTGASSACPADSFNTGLTCRASAGPCDVVETCPGTSATCPADGFNTGAGCRPAAGACDVAETCAGTGASCPADAFTPQGTTCGTSLFCDGLGTCSPCTPNTPCATANVCEKGLTSCSTGSPVCMAAGPQDAGVPCRASVGACDVAESCDGVGVQCPADGLAGASTECRASTGPCDPAERCPGTSVTCPADLLAPASTTCRPLQGTCDVVESCSGAAAGCGPDGFAPAGTVCDQTYLCGGNDAGCPTGCTMDNECAAGSRCLNGVCAATLDGGSPCTQDTQCASTFCVEGVCCNSACAAACDTCTLAGMAGACVPRPQGSAGAPACDPFVCDGASSTCPTACSNSSQCRAGLACVAGQCVMAANNGGVCTQDSECASGFCVDGVCCNSRCPGSCQACDVVGAVGTCTIAGRGELGEPSCAPFVCDGRSGECPTTCVDDADCGPPAFCETGLCSARTRGHAGFGCGCSAIEGGAAWALLAGLAVLRRRRR